MDHATLELVDDLTSSPPAGNEKLRIDEQQLLSAVGTLDDQLANPKWPPKVEQSVAALICSEQEVATDLRGVLVSGLTAVATPTPSRRRRSRSVPTWACRHPGSSALPERYMDVRPFPLRQRPPQHSRF